jgi:tetratricopeptide (TPR) repeat protein
MNKFWARQWPALVVLVLLVGASIYATTLYKGAHIDEASRKKYLAEIETQNKILNQNPNNYSAYINRGVAEYNLGRFDDAVKSYKKASDLKPDNFLSWNNLGNVYREQKKYDLAEQAYKKAMTLDTQSVSPYTNLAKLYEIWPGKEAEVPKVLGSGLAAMPTNEALLRELVNYYEGKNDQVNAEKYRSQLASLTK